MICEYCNSKPATVILTQNIDGQTKTIHMCQDCAAALGVSFDKVDVGQVMGDIDNFFASMFGTKTSNTAPGSTLTCEFCGMSLSELQKTGKCGCANCYNVFSDSVESAIRHLHAATSHCGKIPYSVDGKLSIKRKTDDLKAKLAIAIQNEEYEKAAVIRDEIKAIEAKGEEDNEQKLV